jgi:hypothetical protein
MNYKKTKFKLLILALVNTQALSQPNEGVGAGYVVLCREEQATGFDWENNKWVQRNFKEKTFSISRVPSQNYENLATARSKGIPLCSEPFSKELSHENITWYNACYTMVELGDKPNLLDSRTCVETWIDNKLEAVSCLKHASRFSFAPSGGFSKSTLADVALGKSKKDSAVISVGKCSPSN